MLGGALALGAILAGGGRTTRAPVHAGAASASASSARAEHGPGQAYVSACAPCHGLRGDGSGPSSQGMTPPPRDFGQAIFRYGGVLDGLPREEDLRRIVRDGLPGSAMRPSPLREDEMDEVLRDVRAFAPDAWTPGAEGRPVVPPPDPWEGRPDPARERGRHVYHATATCWSCHPAHVPRAELAAMIGRDDLRDRLDLPVAHESLERRGGRALTVLPPDLAFHRLRSVHPATRHADLFRIIGAGIPGTAMPAWKDALTDEDLWALAHYVGSLGAPELR